MKRWLGGFVYGLVFAATLAIAADVRWSAFPTFSSVGGTVTGVGLQGGANVKFTATPAPVISGTTLTFFDEVIISDVYFVFPTLTALSFPNTTYSLGGLGFIVNSVTALSFPSLTYANRLEFTANSLTSLNLSSLITVSDVFNIHGSSLATLNLSSVTSFAGDFSPTLSALTSLNVGQLATVGGNLSPSFAALTSLNLSSLVSTYGRFVPSAASLTSVTLTSALKGVGISGIDYWGGAGDYVVDFSGTALNQASVDSLLVRLAALDGTGGTTSLHDQGVNVSGGCAAPSATGLAAKATLEGRGNTVTVN